MPIYERIDRRGRDYYQYGNHGAHYYFYPLSEISRMTAHRKAVRQPMAVHASGWKGK